MTELQVKNFSCHLKSEYEAKHKRLEYLRQEIVMLQTQIDTQLTSFQQQDKENKPDHVCQDVNGAVGIGKKLNKMSSELGCIQTDDSREHRYLRYIQCHLSNVKRAASEHMAASGEIIDPELLQVVTDLSITHECLCREKEEVENLINRAYRRQAKIQMSLSKNHSPQNECQADPWLHDFVCKHVNLKKKGQTSQNSAQIPFSPRNDWK